MATSTYGTPYVQGSDLVSAYPTVSSSLATRVDEVSYRGNGLNAQTGTTYTLVVGDAGKTITLSNASAVAVTLPQDSVATLPTGAVVTFYNLGAGTVTISQGTGATLNGGSITLVQYAVTTIIKLSSNTYGRYDDGGGGLSLITTQSFSAVSSVSVNNCFTATYDNYRVLIRVSPSTTNFTMLRLRASGTDTTTTYSGTLVYNTNGNAPAGATQGTGTIQVLGNSANNGSLALDVMSPQASRNTFVMGQAYNYAGDSLSFFGSHGGTTQFDGLTIYPNTGTITGDIRIYGYRN